MRILLLMALAFAGCKQGVGDRCQLVTDCQSGLVCVLPSGGTCAGGGTCEQPISSGQLCSSSADCAAGQACVVQSACPYAGQRACVAAGGSDLGVPQDLATTD